LAADLERAGLPIIGTSVASIDMAEDRKLFQAMLHKLGLRQPQNATATTEEEALEGAKSVGYPVLMRPSFVLGGRAMQIVYNEKELLQYMRESVEVSHDRPVLLDQFLDDATEIDVDCISDGETTLVGSIMEHIERAGVHSGDSACSIPPFSLSDEMRQQIREATYAMAKELNVCGLMNVQYAIQNGDLYVIEVNPRASRTVPFVSKSIGKPLAKLASLVMAGKTLKELDFTTELLPPVFCIKEAVFPFNKFRGVDIILSPEMKSTGEVMGISDDLGMAFAKAQMAVLSPLPTQGKVFLSVRDADKPDAVQVGRSLAEFGFEVCCTRGTAKLLRDAKVEVTELYKLSEGRPNALDMLVNGELALVINTPSGQVSRADEVKIRTTALFAKVPVITTMAGAQAAVKAIRALREQPFEVRALQDIHQQTIKR
jgi:carbamoyl-phosphate synthase large subunit